MPTRCPECGGRQVPIVYGLPAPEAEEQARQGRVILGGCLVGEDDPDFQCDSCGRRSVASRS